MSTLEFISKDDTHIITLTVDISRTLDDAGVAINYYDLKEKGSKYWIYENKRPVATSLDTMNKFIMERLKQHGVE